MQSLPFGSEQSAITLRYYQEEAANALWAGMRTESPCVVLPTGAGKSLVIAAVLRKVLAFGGRAMVLQPSKELIQQNADECRALMPGVDVGLYSAGLGKRHTDQDVVFAGIQSCFDKSHLFGRRDVCLIDECFTGDTPIATPSGNKCLEFVRVGDVVYNASGVGVVDAISVSVKQPITIGLSNGLRLKCTSNHPVFTARGWVAAGSLHVGEYLADIETVSEMWRDVSSQGLSPIPRKSGDENTGTKNLGANEVLLDSLRKAPRQPSEPPGSPTKDQRYAKAERAQADHSRRQRKTNSRSSNATGRNLGAGLATRGSDTDEIKAEGRISALLQARHREPKTEDWNRSGRNGACGQPEAAGHQEGCFVEFVWLEGDSRNEQEGTRIVYNLQVSGHPSYFAGGVLVHNCHLLPPDGEGRFRTFFQGMKSLCPHMVIGGLTATPFRTGTGALCGPENLLTKVCYTASVSRLMSEGYLCQIVNKPMTSELDTSSLKIVARTHEFDAGQAESLFDTDDNVNAAVAEIIEKATGRKSILVFCSGVKHAEHVADRLASLSGEDVGLVTGGTLAIERSNTLQRFKGGQLRWLVNVDVLTTGFNAKQIDCICVLRATASPGLFAQIVGRGFRVHPDKRDCAVLDFGENVKRHGPIDSPTYGIPPEKPKKETGGGMPTKECPACGEAIPISAVVCPECQFAYPPKPKHEANADTTSAILESQVEPTEYLVESATFSRHEKRNAPDAPNTLRIDYVCQLAEGGGNLTVKTISEWVCLDHDGFARRNADQWWRERSKAMLEEDLNESRIDSAISFWKRGAVAIANRIWVVPQGRFNKIIKQELDDVPETWADEQEAVALAYDESGFDYAGLQFGAEVPF